MSTVLLLLSNDRNRSLIARHLEPTYDVVATEEVPRGRDAFDLCILDGRAFEHHREELFARKEATEPVFLPYLLFTNRDELAALPASMWKLADDVIRTPVVKAELDARIEQLLHERELSIDLERRRERSEERFRTLFEVAPDPVVVVDADGVVTEANESFRRLFGVTDDDVGALPITELSLVPEESVRSAFGQAVDGANRPDDTTVVEFEEGTDSTVYLGLNVDLLTGLNEVTECIGTFRDITELKERQRRLVKQNERLKEFASTVAHDLRNPLAIAQGHLEFVREGEDGEAYDTVASALDRMEELVQEILTMARRGQLVLDAEEVELSEVARAAWQQVTTKDAELVVERDGTLRAHEGRLTELFENLFRNAVEHGHDNVTVSLGVTDAADGLYVEDDGPGIRPGDHDQVFDAGYTETEGGTGFGLSIVRQIVEGHGWTVSVTDGRDGGARFEITGVEPLQPTTERGPTSGQVHGHSATLNRATDE